jgi:hypothetical protein
MERTRYIEQEINCVMVPKKIVSFESSIVCDVTKGVV